MRFSGQGTRQVAAWDRNWPAWRKWPSNFGNNYARTILRMPIKDLTGVSGCGGALHWPPCPGIECVPMVTFSWLKPPLRRLNLAFKIKEVPIYFAERTRGKSKMDISIQLEAALRVWSLIPRYCDIKRLPRY